MCAQADLLLNVGWLFSAEPNAEPVRDAAVAVKDARIVALGTRAEISSRWHSASRIELPEHLLLPGLVNCHTHSPMTLLRGIGNALPLHEWLHECIFPLEARWVSDKFVADGARLAITEMLRSGITCFADHYYFPEVIARVAREIGIRAQIATPVIEQPNNWASSSEECLRRTTELHDEFQNDDLIRIAHGPHAPYTVSIETFEKIATISEEIQSQVHIHLHETAREVAEFRLQHGVTPIRKLHEIGLLTPRLQAVHMTAVDERDREIIAECQVGAVHCPQSNALLASGPSPLTMLEETGIRVALGTDGPATNNSLDLFQEMRAANLLSRAGTDAVSTRSAADFVRMASLQGASLLGRDEDIGSIRVGKWADLIAIDMAVPEAQPIHDVLANILLTNSGSRVTHLWIAGQPLLAEGRLLACDQDAVIAHAREWRDTIHAGEQI